MSDIHVSDLTNTTTITNGVANGTGVFDKLFNTVNLYIDDQYRNGRLKGPEYASVLLGSIQAVLAESVQFVLQEQLVEAQTAEVLDGTIRANIALNDELLSTAKERDLKVAQTVEVLDSTVRANTALDDGLLTSAQDREVKEVQKANLTEERKGMFANRIVSDKQAVLLGLDQIVKTLNTSPEAVYTPKYEV